MVILLLVLFGPGSGLSKKLSCQEIPSLSRNPIIMFDDHEVLWDNFANSSWILDTIVQDVFPEIGTDPQGLANLKSIHNIREIYKFKNSNYRFVIYWSAFEGRNRQIRETWSMVYLAYSKCLS